MNMEKIYLWHIVDKTSTAQAAPWLLQLTSTVSVAQLAQVELIVILVHLISL